MVTLKDVLKEKFSEKELSKLKLSYDIIGDIAVINELPTGMKRKGKIIAEELMNLNHNIKVVCKKAGATSGIERIRHVKVILGEKRTETIHIENGCKYKLDINKTFFSPRLGHEHLRVAEQVSPGELVFDLFAGVGPFTIPIAKRGAKVIACDINKNSIKFLNENILLNKVAGRVETFVGDSKKVFKKEKFKGKADRILMNLPMKAKNFLDLAFFLAKKGTIIHFYCFLHDNEIFDGGIKIVKEAATQAGKKIKILTAKKCGQLSPRIWRCVIDFKIS